MNFIKRIFKHLIYGLKSSNDLAFNNQNTDFSCKTNIVENIETERLSKDLLKAQVTEQVKELRYKDYKVSNESKKFKYLNGEVTRTNTNINHLKFSQDNKLICEGVLDELKRIDKYGTERYVLNFVYKDVPRFKLEKYCTKIDVNLNDDMLVKLHFSKYPDKYDVTSKAFINELGTLSTNPKNEICDNIQTISFVTYKSDGEDDFVSYIFHEFNCIGISENNHEYIISYKISYYLRDNLIDKFYSNTMETKYKNKEKKMPNTYADVTERVEKCDLCGVKINTYDADITRETYGKALCINCLENEILKN